MTRSIIIAARVLGAAAIGATAGIHMHLWLGGYRQIPTIGPMFLLNVIGGSLLVFALLGTPRRFLGLTALAGLGYEVLTLVALLLATTRGLFGFQESSAAPLYWQAVGVEAFGGLVLLGLVLATLRLPGRAVRRQHPTTA